MEIMLSLQLWCSSVAAVKGIGRVPHPVWPIVKYVHQLESVAIRQTWCEHVHQSICWHSGQRYVINADFTLHWIELATLATTSMLVRPIKTSLFIYLQLQPSDLRGMNPPHTHFRHTECFIFFYLYKSYSISQKAILLSARTNSHIFHHAHMSAHFLHIAVVLTGV